MKRTTASILAGLAVICTVLIASAQPAEPQVAQAILRLLGRGAAEEGENLAARGIARGVGHSFEEQEERNAGRLLRGDLETGRFASPYSRLLPEDSKPPSAWKSWADVPAHLPPGGYTVPRNLAAGELSPERYPGIFIPKKEGVQLNLPRSLEILSKEENGIPFSDAVKALLIGPDKRIFAEYVKSPEGRYILDVPAHVSFGPGRYEIIIVADSEKRTLLRKISIIPEGTNGPVCSTSDHLNIFVMREDEVQSAGAVRGFRRTTFELSRKGERAINSAIEDTDKALMYNKAAYEALNVQSSFELRWKVTLNYARSLHNSVVFYKYGYAPDAQKIFRLLHEELMKDEDKWFWQPKLKDIGIKGEDISEPLRDLRALELQHIYGRYLTGPPEKISTFSDSIYEFVNGFLEDEQALSKRLDVSRETLIPQIRRAIETLQKLNRPALIEENNGDYLLESIQPPPDELPFQFGYGVSSGRLSNNVRSALRRLTESQLSEW